MDPSQQKEQFSVAYLSAVVAVAGYNLYQPRVDVESVDWEIAAGGPEALMRRPRVEVQLKCTSRRDPFPEGPISFRLKVKNYDDLRPDNLMVPRILVVVLVPRKPRDWFRHTEDELVLRHCGYWVSLRGLPPTSNTRSVSIAVPRTQVFAPEALEQIMKRINEGGTP